MFLINSRRLCLALGVAALVGTVAVPAKAQTIDTTGAWNGSQYGYPWGVDNTATYGQTFTAPNTQLNDFTFYLRANSASTADIVYKAYVYGWDGSKATGPALFASPTQTFVQSNSFTPVTTNTGGVTLNTGSQYVMFFSTAGLQAGRPNSTTQWEAVPSTAYAGGQFVYINNTNDFSQLTTQNWTDYGQDTAFKANFSQAGVGVAVTPEASGVANLAGALLAPGMAGMVALRCRKKTKAKTAA